MINNKTSSLFEPHLDYLEDKLNTISSQLESFEPNRNKRGLIDGLGSLIKSISGNLDYTDAIKYNNAIQVLQENQDKLQVEFKNHISLSKDWMLEYSNIIEKISENQQFLAEKLNSLINQHNDRQAVGYAHLAQYILLLNDNVETLSDELYKLELMLAFIRASSTMHSMVRLVNLKNMLSKLKLIYPKDQILDIELREYYNILKVGSYYSNKQIVIVIKLPIASPTTYTLYKLSIVPTNNNLAILPPLPYIAIQGLHSMYIETECPKINSWFLCEQKLHSIIEEKPDCIQQLITEQNSSSCTLTPISLNKEAMEQLDDRHYTLSFPTPTKILIACGQEQYKTVKGSYLAIIPQNCFIKTPGFTIFNTNDRIKGHILKIIQSPLNQRIIQKKEGSVKLHSIYLANLHNGLQKVSVQEPVKLNHTNAEIIYHTTIPVYLILLCTITIAVLWKYRRYVRNKPVKETQLESAHQIYAQVEPRKIRPDEVKINTHGLAATYPASPRK